MKWHLSDSATGMFSGLEVGIYDVVPYEIEKDNTIDIDNRVHAETVQITKPQVAMATTNSVFSPYVSKCNRCSGHVNEHMATKCLRSNSKTAGDTDLP